MDEILASINFLGYPINDGEIESILNPETHPNIHQSIRTNLDSFFGIEAKYLNEEILSRYVKTSQKDLYIGITPHEYQIISNIFIPYKGAKRCYCLGEFLACIELCAHISEMLTCLLNLIHPITINNNRIDKQTEKNLFGKTFTKLNQANRLNILKAFNIIDDKTHKKFEHIRMLRNSHFHLFGHDRSNIEQDSFECFESITILIKEILEIKINDNPPPQYTINTALKNFILNSQSPKS